MFRAVRKTISDTGDGPNRIDWLDSGTPMSRKRDTRLVASSSLSDLKGSKYMMSDVEPTTLGTEFRSCPLLDLTKATTWRGKPQGLASRPSRRATQQKIAVEIRGSEG